MANPRWVLAPHVDSSAMLAAVLHFKTVNENEWQRMSLEGQLTMITHHSGHPDPPTNPMFRRVKCPDPTRCSRCISKKGGYVFRWLSPMWAKKYEELSSPGAWKPGQLEGYVPENFVSQIVDCEGNVQ